MYLGKIGAIVSLFFPRKMTFGPIKSLIAIGFPEFIGKTANKLIPIHITFSV
jgi:hypothetical protein|tara:strand:- start:1249 stop:1404 length:156 start_codon:yes stop_codon:yes gene_type:complete